MKLPQYIGDKITDYIDAEDFSHQQECHDAGLDQRDTDPVNELPWTLGICFPEHMHVDGLRTYRTIDWGESWAAVWMPTRRRLKLCKIGWHSYTRGYSITRLYYCADCPATTPKVPRWAR